MKGKIAEVVHKWGWQSEEECEKIAQAILDLIAKELPKDLNPRTLDGFEYGNGWNKALQEVRGILNVTTCGRNWG